MATLWINSVADPDPRSRILIFTHPQYRISHPGSRIQKQKKREGWKKIRFHSLFSSHKFHKIKIILFLKCRRKKCGPIFNYRTFAQKIATKLSKIWVWYTGSGIRKKPVPDPGSRGSKRHRIRIRNTVNKYGTRGSGKRLCCIDVSTGVVTTGAAANQVVQHSEEPDQKIHC